MSAVNDPAAAAPPSVVVAAVQQTPSTTTVVSGSACDNVGVIEIAVAVDGGRGPYAVAQGTTFAKSAGTRRRGGPAVLSAAGQPRR